MLLPLLLPILLLSTPPPDDERISLREVTGVHIVSVTHAYLLHVDGSTLCRIADLEPEYGGTLNRFGCMDFTIAPDAAFMKSTLPNPNIVITSWHSVVLVGTKPIYIEHTVSTPCKRMTRQECQKQHDLQVLEGMKKHAPVNKPST